MLWLTEVVLWLTEVVLWLTEVVLWSQVHGSPTVSNYQPRRPKASTVRGGTIREVVAACK